VSGDRDSQRERRKERQEEKLALRLHREQLRKDRLRAERLARPSRFRDLFEGRKKYLTWTIIYLVWGGTGAGIVLATLPAGPSAQGTLPEHPGTVQLFSCGCLLPEGGRLDLEVERTPEGTLEWALSNPERRMLLVSPTPEAIQDLPLPLRLVAGTSVDVYLGCAGTAVVVASFEEIGAFDFPGGRPRWTRKLPRRVWSSVGSSDSGDEIRCHQVTVDTEAGIAEIPVQGGATSRFDLATGQPR
jgi:hypothetical protein